MGSGIVHSNISIGASIGAIVGYGIAQYVNLDQALCIGGGLLFGVLSSPDHDVDNGNISYQYIRKLFGFPGLWLWFLIWKPYAIALKHRSFLSHFPVISSLFRLCYLYFPIIINLTPNQEVGFFNLLFRSIISQIVALPLLFVTYILLYEYSGWGYYVVPFVTGLIISDFLHYLTDIF